MWVFSLRALDALMMNMGLHRFGTNVPGFLYSCKKPNNVFVCWGKNVFCLIKEEEKLL